MSSGSDGNGGLERSPSARLIRLVDAALIAASLLFIALLGYTALSRIAYPYELNWMDGGMVDHVRRVMAGERLYVAPSIDFVPYIYSPLYFYVAAGVSAVTGVGFWPLRLISLIGAGLSLAIIAWLVRRETGRWQAGLIGAGLFAATYAESGAWFDLGRVDSLALLLTLLAIALTRAGNGWRSALIGALILTLAGLTKQTALAIAPALTLYLLLTDWRRALVFGGGLLIATGGVTLALDAIHDGWYRFYVFTLPAQHPWVESMWARFWTEDLLPLTIAGVVGVGGLLLPLAGGRRGKAPQREESPWHDRWDAALFYLPLLACLLIGSWSGRLHEGGSVNVLMPTFALMAVAAAIVYGRLAARAGAVIGAALLIQFALLIYNPARYIPTAADRAAGDYLIEAIQQIGGEVLVYQRGYVAALAGDENVHAHRMAVYDVFNGRDERVKGMLYDSITQALNERRFDAILFDGSPDNFILVDGYFGALEPNYVGRGPIFPPEMGDAYWPVVGLQTRPYYVFVPRAQ